MTGDPDLSSIDVFLKACKVFKLNIRCPDTHQNKTYTYRCLYKTVMSGPCSATSLTILSHKIVSLYIEFMLQEFNSMLDPFKP